jgi:hypothetical protein
MELITHQTAMSPQKNKKSAVLALKQNMEIPKTRQGWKLNGIWLSFSHVLDIHIPIHAGYYNSQFTILPKSPFTICS